MAQDQAIADLNYLKTLAEAGRRSPLLGGPIGIMWSLLLIPALTYHGMTAKEMTGLESSQIGFIWMMFGLTGGIISMIMGRKTSKKQGAQSIGNTIESTVWPATAALLFTYAISVAIATAQFEAPYMLFNTIMVMAFALYTLSMATLARLTGERYLAWAAGGSALFMVLCTLFIMRPEVYFLAAVGVFATSLVPSLIEVRRESDYAG